MVQVELVKPNDFVPEGVSFSVKQFLTVPSNQEIGDALQTNDDVHKLIKVTKRGSDFIIETIQEYETIESRYFTTRLLQKKPLCYLTASILRFGCKNPVSHHNATKTVTIGRDKAKNK